MLALGRQKPVAALKTFAEEKMPKGLVVRCILAVLLVCIGLGTVIGCLFLGVIGETPTNTTTKVLSLAGMIIGGFIVNLGQKIVLPNGHPATLLKPGEDY